MIWEILWPYRSLEANACTLKCALLEMMDAQGAPPLETQDPVEVRNARLEPMKLLGGEPDVLGRVEDLSIPGPAGDIPARLYANEHAELRPALVYFHGGGFVFENLDTGR
jgi:acetyl esterase